MRMVAKNMNVMCEMKPLEKWPGRLGTKAREESNGIIKYIREPRRRQLKNETAATNKIIVSI
jgi:hypothetical protein